MFKRVDEVLDDVASELVNQYATQFQQELADNGLPIEVMDLPDKEREQRITDWLESPEEYLFKNDIVDDTAMYVKLAEQVGAALRIVHTLEKSGFCAIEHPHTNTIAQIDKLRKLIGLMESVLDVISDASREETGHVCIAGNWL